MILFVSQGWNISTHYCSVNHTVTHSFGDASENCQHCTCHHSHHEDASDFARHLQQVHFGKRCCCDDIVKKLSLEEYYISPTLKTWIPFLQGVVTQAYDSTMFEPKVFSGTLANVLLRVPWPRTGMQMLLMFSQLKLDPSLL